MYLWDGGGVEDGFLQEGPHVDGLWVDHAASSYSLLFSIMTLLNGEELHAANCLFQNSMWSFVMKLTSSSRQ